MAVWPWGIVERAGSSAIAKLRLQRAIAADRAAVPCGRWVRRHYGIYHAAIVAGYASAAWDAYRRGDLGLARLYHRELLRPRYRYEVRR